MFSKCSCAWSVLGVAKKARGQNRGIPEKEKTAYMAKHFFLKSSASSERMTSSGTGGGCLDW